jgi:maleylacetate reductase
VRAFVHEALPGRVVFGIDAVLQVVPEVMALGAGRVLLIADGAAQPVADLLADQLGSQLAARVSEVRQHVPEELVTATQSVVVATSPDAIVTIGGGSATGLGKAVAIETGIPLVVVPTTFAGSEMTPVYGITGEHKQTGRDLRALPCVVIYDPKLTMTLPKEVIGPSGLNAIAHCVEALYAPGTNPIGDLYAVEGVRILARALPAILDEPDDLEARGDALFGAHLAGKAFAVAGSALHHKLCHVLGGTFRLVHGEVNSVVLPHATSFNAPAVPDAMARITEALGGSLDGSAAAGLLFDLALRLGAPTSLDAIGMPADGLDFAAERAVAEVGAANPRSVDRASMRSLLQDAFDGRRP